MTMDLQQRAREPCSGCNDTSRRPNSPRRSPEETTVTATSTGVKRSFDVAFLVAPDTKKLQHEQERSMNLARKSAFTKVMGKEGSPERGLSPYDAFVPKQFHQPQQKSPLSSFSLPQPSSFLLNQSREKLLSSYLNKPRYPGYPSEKELLHPLLYPAEAYISAAYPYAASSFASATSPPPALSHQPQVVGRPSTSGQQGSSNGASSSSSSPPAPPSFLSVAVSPVSALLPPSLAALSLPAQNVCAKCNLSFRMTSDLVYHMRSHHKQEAADPLRRKREEKLKCPVCSESFRERHHLTRHMTAHQDKAGDREDTELPGAPPK